MISEISFAWRAALFALLVVSTSSTGILAGPASKWYLVHESVVEASAEIGFPGEVLAYDPATGAVASEQSIGGDGVGLSGYIRIDADRFAYSLNSHAELGGLVIAPNDVVLSDSDSLSKAIDGTAAGIPEGVKIDAVHQDETGQWVISLNVHAVIDGTTYADGDLIGYDGESFFLVASEADLGLETSADVSGITQGTGGRWLVTLASGGQTLDGLVYFAGDVLLGDSDGQLSAIALSSREAPLSVTAGLNAISAEPAPDELFSDRFQE